jgi:two-component system, NtrC family, response regulator
MVMNKLLIVDDNEDIRKQLKWGLSKDYELVLAQDAIQALDLFRVHKPRVVTLDLGLPPHEESSEEGLSCLAEILKLDSTVKVVVITGNDAQENALQAVNMGAYDFYRKPIDLDELRIIIKRAFHLQALERENLKLQKRSQLSVDNYCGMIGQSPKMQEVFETIRKVAQSDIPVLISGESGTGKELVARALHSQSSRRDKAFVVINCGAIPENLLESELFGHEKGAFTGAYTMVMGKCEYAHQGTLFLDEIGELPLNLQVKLLRFLQEKVIQRVGGRKDIPVDARVATATNIDIVKAMESGTFREDLFYRIGVVNIQLPPLRERGDDIIVLANMFLRRFCEDFQRNVSSFSHDALKYMRTYAWPGNVRELENKVQRAVIMSNSARIEPAHLGFAEMPNGSSWPAPSASTTLREARENVEREMIRNALLTHGGNLAKTAEELGITRPTIYTLMKKYGLARAESNGDVTEK